MTWLLYRKGIYPLGLFDTQFKGTSGYDDVRNLSSLPIQERSRDKSA